MQKIDKWIDRSVLEPPEGQQVSVCYSVPSRGKGVAIVVRKGDAFFNEQGLKLRFDVVGWSPLRTSGEIKALQLGLDDLQPKEESMNNQGNGRPPGSLSSFNAFKKKLYPFLRENPLSSVSTIVLRLGEGYSRASVNSWLLFLFREGELVRERVTKEGTRSFFCYSLAPLVDEASEQDYGIDDFELLLDLDDFELLLDQELASIKSMLMEKNRRYGNSALKPIRIFSRSDPAEGIRVRIDDKLSRLLAGQVDDDEDPVRDLSGYLILLQIEEKIRERYSGHRKGGQGVGYFQRGTTLSL